jgi:tetratricopeptide (TPR) repeat protein
VLTVKSIGVITKYYRYLDSETQNRIDTLIEASADYPDFVARLGDRVFSEKSSSILAYLSVRHALNVQQHDVIDRISTKYGDVGAIGVLVLLSRGLRGDLRSTNDALSLADSVISTSVIDWLTMEMHNVKLFSIVELQANIGELENALNAAQRHLGNRRDLECLSFWIYWTRANILRESGNHKEAVRVFEVAHSISNEYNDTYEAAFCMRDLGRAMKSSDMQKGLELLIEAGERFKELGNRLGAADVLNSIGVISTSMGEFDQAIECFIESIRLRESVQLIPTIALLNLSWLYSDIGDGERANYYAKKGLNACMRSHGEFSDVHAYASLATAYALTIMEEIEGAKHYLDDSLERLVSTGNEENLIRYYFVRGLVERQLGDLESVSKTFLRVLRLSEKLDSLRFIVACFLNLAEVEVAMFVEDSKLPHLEKASLFLSRVEQIANEQSYPNVIVEISILKAELLKAKGMKDAARQSLSEALEFCKKGSMKTIQKKVQDALNQLDIEESKSEVAKRVMNLIGNVVVPSGKALAIPFEILGCIVIVRNAGVEAFSKYLDDRLTSDPSMVAALISAVSSFTHELREDSGGELHSIVHHDIAVLLEHGKLTTCALLTDKDTYDARAALRRFLEKFEARFYEQLKKFDGGLKIFESADELFYEVLMPKND